MPSLAEPHTIRLAAPLRRAGFNAGEIRVATERDTADTARQAAYQQGFTAASEFFKQQLAEQRAEVIQLTEKTFASLDRQRAELLGQIGAVLPRLAIEIARRLLCGLPPDPARVHLTVDEVLGELAPGTRDIEIALHPADLELLGHYDEKLRDRYPGLRFLADAALALGDCRLRSNFGLIDATLATKLANLSRALQ